MTQTQVGELGGYDVGLSESGQGRVKDCFGYDNGYSGSRKPKNYYSAIMIHSRILLPQLHK